MKNFSDKLTNAVIGIVAAVIQWTVIGYIAIVHGIPAIVSVQDSMLEDIVLLATVL